MNIIRFFKNLRIRARLLFAFGTLIIMSGILVFFTFQTFHKIDSYKRLNDKTDSLFMSMQAMEIAMDEFIYEEFKSKDFLQEGKSPAQTDFRNNYSIAKLLVLQLSRSPVLQQDEAQGYFKKIRASMQKVANQFSGLTEKLQQRGFKDFGMEGNLRKAIHDVEQADFIYDKADLLTLRRHEKDFFLRKDLKYQDEFNKALVVFREKTEKSASPTVLSMLAKYQEGFNEIVEKETQIGLTENAGLRGELRKEIKILKPTINEFNSYVNEQSRRSTEVAIAFLIFIVTIQLGLGIFLSIFFSNQITRPVKEIKWAVQDLANGKYPHELKVDSNEEMGQTKSGFNQFVQRLRVATTFAEAMGSGNLQLTYDKNFSSDVLAKALVNMQSKLREAHDHKSKINWVNEGGSKFNDILKKEGLGLEELGDEILRFVVTYVGSNQAALYIKEEDYLNRVSTYAYDKKRFVDQRIEVGNGLVGQVALEGETVYLKQVPSNYLAITSGLGHSKPREVLIMPLKVNKHIMGVMELASFAPFEKHQIEFLDKISDNIAMLLSTRKNNELTAQLLREANERVQSLNHQEKPRSHHREIEMREYSV
jgi:HAMP domain-containing protein/putative methionine-R-sulfoxide reductase with GAF domain